jgi:predicted PurR-regulated permease PerM
MKLVTDEPDRRALWTLNIKLTPKLFYGALIIVLSVWILQSFLQALLAACVTAIATGRPTDGSPVCRRASGAARLLRSSRARWSYLCWQILMGCLGGFEVLGLVGLVIGPVLLTLTRELCWRFRSFGRRGRHVPG